jgi:signal transduction histidine kinase/CheY-like chemotaxis protein
MNRDPIRALLVEDNPDDADVLREILADARAPVRIETVERLDDALGRLNAETFDLVLLDLSLPDSHGLGTVERTLEDAAHAPIVVLTGLEDEALGSAAVQRGAQDYLVKGQLDGPGLVRCMRYAIERHRLLSEQTENASVWAALARASEALLETTGSQALLDRLCQVAQAELHCASACVWTLDADGSSYLPAAAIPQPFWQSIAGGCVPRNALEPLRNGPEGELAARWLTPELRASLPAGILPPEDEVLLLGLVRGGELVAVQLCGYGRRPLDTEATGRIADGFRHLAVLALSNARLVEELERSNTVKTYFAATMSHELRNTLFAIGGYAEILLGSIGGSDDPEAERRVRTIADRSRDSLALIQAALELTHSDVHHGDLQVEELNVAEMMEQIAQEVHVPASKPDLRLQWKVCPDLPPLRSNAVKFGMILRNLIGNAIKFTERGTITVGVTPIEGALRFSVADTGIGIYIVRRLVDILGGEIDVESRNGKGTRFTLTLPLLANWPE